MSQIRVKVVGKFIPHQLLLRAAWHHLESSKEGRDGCFYDWLASCLSSALSIEAIGNTYGEALIPNWFDFETASPIAKLRLVADSCKVKLDFGIQPWGTAKELIKLRNRVAHAKPQRIEVDDVFADDAYQRVLHSKPESDLEKMVTAEFAARGYKAIENILEIFSTNIEPSKLVEIEMEGWSGQATVVSS